MWGPLRTLWNIALGAGVGAHGLLDRLGTGRWRTDLQTRSGRVAVPQDLTQPRILVHGVSLGEVNGLAPLVRELAASEVGPNVIVSSATETGYARAQALYSADHTVVRFPLDFTWMTSRFLDAVAPELVVLAELELWPGFVGACRRREIPLCIVSGRFSPAGFKRYTRVRPLITPAFKALSLVGAQSERARDQFIELGTDPARTVVTGSLKWDAVSAPENPGDEGTAAEDIGRTLGIDPEKPLVVAGSTGPGEEAMLIRSRPPGIQLLLAPRKPERWDEVARLQPAMPRRSATPESQMDPTQRHEVFLLDTIGELKDAYRIADAVFVGRSLVELGGSNPLEAVALGKPTVMGPHYANFEGIVSELVEAGGLAVSTDPWAEITRWLASPEAKAQVAQAGLAAVSKHRGTAARTAGLVLAQLSGTHKPG
ncbi:MAG: 3-deoxy-D-manno-octulosonic acid transferase [Longimicrobiales bacterium]